MIKVNSQDGNDKKRMPDLLCMDPIMNFHKCDEVGLKGTRSRFEWQIHGCCASERTRMVMPNRIVMSKS